MKDKEKQIEEIISIMAASNDPFVDVPIEIMPKVAEVLYNAGYRKLPKDSVVLSWEEYEMRVTQYKNLEIKYSNLSDNYRLCKDANETIKQFAVKARKETAKEILERGKYCMPSGLRDWIKERYGVEVEE